MTGSIAMGLTACNSANTSDVKLIYGKDNRVLVGDISNPTTKESLAIQATVSLWTGSDLIENSDGDFTFNQRSFGESKRLCENEPFRDLPSKAWCSGFLVAPDIIATAGHCVTSQRKCDTTKFVFGFHDAEGGSTSIIRKENVFSCAGILSRFQTDSDKNDYALIKLDRPVEDRTPFRLSDSKPEVGDELTLYGHPSGLPQIQTSGARVRSISNSIYLVANSDSYGGNSGSPVVDQSGKIAGILVRGDTDFIMNVDRGCYESNRVGEDSGRGEDITRVDSIKSLVEASEPKYPLNPYSSSDFGFVDGEASVSYLWSQAPKKAELTLSSAYGSVTGLHVTAYDADTKTEVVVEELSLGSYLMANHGASKLLILVENPSKQAVRLDIKHKAGKLPPVILEAGDLTNESYRSGAIHLNPNEGKIVNFTLSKNTELSMKTVSSIDTKLYLYKQTTEGSFKQITEDDDSGVGRNGLIEKTLEPGSYYLLVGGYSARTEGEIEIVIDSKEPAPMTIDFNAGDITNQNYSTDMTQLERGGEKKVLFKLSEIRKVKMQTKSSIDTKMELYKKNVSGTFVTIASNDDSGDNLNALIERTLAAGEYYLVVKGFSSYSSSGAITILIEPSAP